MRRVLVIAYYFPPIGGIGSVRLARFVSYLPEFGWEATVIAPAATPHSRDPGLQFPEDRVIRSRSIELSRLARAVPGASVAASGGSAVADSPALRNRARRFAYRYVFYPDGQIGWLPGALASGVNALRRGEFDAVYSSSNPITAHLVARRLSRRSRLPWVAEFRDPWNALLPHDHPYRRRADRLMSALGHEADAVVMPTPGMVEHYGHEWGRHITLIRNGLDIEPVAGEEPERPTLVHLGTYYSGRQDFRALWAAIAQLLREDPPVHPRIRFIGDVPQELLSELSDVGLGDLVEVTGFLPHAEAMRAIASGSALIASGFAGSDLLSRGVIPAKVFEYLATDRPILYFGRHDDDAGELLAGQPGVHVIDPADAGGALTALRAALAGERFVRDLEPFSRRSGAEALAGVLSDAAGSGAPRTAPRRRQ